MPTVICFRHSLVFFTLFLGGTNAYGEKASQLSQEDLTFFEIKIRPILATHCYECHSNSAEEVGGKLLLDSRDGSLAGGESGSIFDFDTPENSLIVQALRHDGPQMPPEAPLPDTVVNDFAEWIRRGAPDPREPEPQQVQQVVAPVPNSHWAFQSPQKPHVPEVKDVEWPHSAIDHFALARMEAAGITPSADADPRTLIRRLSFDLVGLPPSMELVQRFETASVEDPQQATETLVDELLASPQFGERWGRYWLDVARYGESNGNDGLGRNPTFPHAWRYRDYVIDAFNRDTPYDQFLTEQIAGDLLSTDSPEERDKNLVATGFLAMSAKPAKAMNTNFDMDVVADQIDVISRGVMGITVACARCHDHKFDPIPTSEYYALAGMFTSTETMWGMAGHEGLTAPSTDLHVLKTPERVPPPEDFEETVLVLESNTGKPKPIPKPKWPPGTPLAMGVRDKKEPADCKIHIKGDVGKLGDVVPRGFLSLCQFESSESLEISAKQSGRLELAKWITRPDHPLTSRVMANRVWMHLFGTGLVSTPDEFGLTGEDPTHPELLDYLATRFVEQEWSIKRLIREIVLSRTYQLSSLADGKSSDQDIPLLARHQRRRLDAESLRDAMLSASGTLNLAPGDGSIIRHRDILINLAGSLHQPSDQRSVYLCYLRHSPPPELMAFDLPEFTKSVGQRGVNTVPDQALYLYNNPFVIDQAEQFAQSAIASESNDENRIRSLWQRAYQRSPSQAEIADAMAYIQATRSELDSDEKAWSSLCQAVLVANEFRYVD